MRFFIATAALIGAAAALTETVQIKDLTVRDNGDIQATSFKVQPANVDCSSTSAADLASDVAVVCGTSAYRFELRDGSNGKYELTVHKQTGEASGITGKTEFGVQCHAGGNGQNDMVCSPAADVSVTLKN